MLRGSTRWAAILISYSESFTFFTPICFINFSAWGEGGDKQPSLVWYLDIGTSKEASVKYKKQWTDTQEYSRNILGPLTSSLPVLSPEVKKNLKVYSIETRAKRLEGPTWYLFPSRIIMIGTDETSRWKTEKLRILRNRQLEFI